MTPRVEQHFEGRCEGGDHYLYKVIMSELERIPT